jgi:hypothetical protein
MARVHRDFKKRKYMMGLFEAFNFAFRGRQDVVPRRWANRKGDVGYSPICKKRFTPACPRVLCDLCPEPDFEPVSESLYARHFAGREILGVYPMLADGRSCNFIAGDFDNHDGDHDPFADIQKIRSLCLDMDIPFYVFKSQSGRGCHGYIFFSETVAAADARAVYFAILERCDIPVRMDRNGKNAISSFDRLFPNQDSLPPGSKGNLIALPFIGINSANPRSLPMDYDGDAEDWLNEIDRMTADDLAGLIAEWEINVVSSRTVPASGRVYESPLLAKCEFLRHCKDDAAILSEPEWHAMICLVVRETGGPALVHSLSGSYPGYRYEETARKIENVLNGQAAPLSCEYLKSLWDCGQNCGVKRPADLRHDTVPELEIVIPDDFESALIAALSLVPILEDDDREILRHIRETDPERWERIRPALKAVKGVRITDIDAATKKQKQKKPKPGKVSAGLPYCYWYEDTKSDGALVLKISSDGIISELERLGVCNMDTPNGVSLAYIKNNVVKLVDAAYVRNMVLNDLYDQLPEVISENYTNLNLREILRKNIGRLLSEPICDTFRKVEFRPVRDTAESVFLFFKNGFVEVRAETADFKDYSKMEGHVWESGISEHDYDTSLTSEHNADFSRFCDLACGEDKERLLAMKSVIGKNISRYNSPAYAVAPIWMEVSLSDPDEPSGGTGKTLLATCHRFLRNVVEINVGRVKTDGTFAFQGIKPDAESIVLDEVPIGFDLSLLFSDITRGLTVEDKNKTRWTFPREDNPGIQLITNYAIKGDSASFKRRVHEMILSDYFSDERTPEDEFGRLFFEDWTPEEWQGYYNFMTHCVQVFLRNGGRMHKHDTAGAGDDKRALAAVGRDFFEYANGMERDTAIPSQLAYEEFLAALSPKNRAKMSAYKFGRLMAKYCRLKRITLRKISQSSGGKTTFSYFLEVSE